MFILSPKGFSYCSLFLIVTMGSFSANAQKEEKKDKNKPKVETKTKVAPTKGTIKGIDDKQGFAVVAVSDPLMKEISYKLEVGPSGNYEDPMIILPSSNEDTYLKQWNNLCKYVRENKTDVLSIVIKAVGQDEGKEVAIAINSPEGLVSLMNYRVP